MAVSGCAGRPLPHSAMSLARLPLPQLAWAELQEVLQQLDLRELWVWGCSCRAAFVAFLREKALREGVKTRPSSFRLPRFLFKSSPHEKALLVSYPRSGNSFMRKVLERETGIVTGSDSRPNRTLSSSLLKFGYAGEGITDQSVWVVKSHYPERLGYVKFSVRKVVLLVRNPFDAIQSYFHMGMTNTHDKNLSDAAFAGLGELWRECMVNEAAVWANFHQFWVERVGEANLLVLRYEDLLECEQEVVTKTVAFLRAAAPPLALQRYRRQAAAQPAAAGYKTRNKTIGKALTVMSVRDATAIAHTCSKHMELFGYRLVTTSVAPDLQLGAEGWDAAAATSMRLDVLPVAPQFREPVPAAPTAGALVVNSAPPTRSDDDKFGRKITDVRKALTCDDTCPFPVR